MFVCSISSISVYFSVLSRNISSSPNINLRHFIGFFAQLCRFGHEAIVKNALTFLGAKMTPLWLCRSFAYRLATLSSSVRVVS